jgi:hypothetical protein
MVLKCVIIIIFLFKDFIIQKFNSSHLSGFKSLNFETGKIKFFTFYSVVASSRNFFDRESKSV